MSTAIFDIAIFDSVIFDALAMRGHRPRKWKDKHQARIRQDDEELLAMVAAMWPVIYSSMEGGDRHGQKG